MDLKTLLGEELYKQVTEKAGDTKIAIVSDGNWFPKDKFDEKNTEVKDLKQQLKDRDVQLENLKKKAKDSEELQQTIKDLQKENEDTKKEYEENLLKTRKEAKLELALKEAQAKNPKAVKALLDAEKISLDGENLVGLEEQLKALQESDSYLFGGVEPAGLKGRKPNDSNEPPVTTKNPFSKEHFNLTEQARLYKEDPELYKQLKAQA
jgi:hypothetical protein